MSTDRVGQIRERLARATPGPWGQVRRFWDSVAPAEHCDRSIGASVDRDDDQRLYAKVLARIRKGRRFMVGEAEANAALVAHAPGDIAYLLGEVERLREKAEDAEADALRAHAEANGMRLTLARYGELASSITERDMKALALIRAEEPSDGFELNRRCQLSHVEEILGGLRTVAAGETGG